MFDPETLMAAQYVAARRLTVMWGSAWAPSASDNSEMTRMVTEKWSAAAESLASVPLAVARASAAAGRSTLGGAPPPIAFLSGATQAVDTMLAPATRRIRANAERLLPV